MNLKKILLLIFLSCAALSLAQAKPLYFIVTDLEGMEELQREFGAFKTLLEEKTGLELKFYPVTSRTAAAEAVRAKKADFILTGPAEYVVMRTLTKCEPVISFSRPDYYSVILVRADSHINSIRDLKGKKVAMSDVGSTSGHLGPSQVIKDGGLDPLRDIKIVHTSKEIAWESLKKGDVAAWGYGGTNMMRVRDADKTVDPGMFKIIARGPDLPNDILVAAPHTAREDVAKVVKAIRDNPKDMIAAILKGDDNAKYKGMQFLDTVKDSDYDYVRSMYRTIGQPKFSSFVGN